MPTHSQRIEPKTAADTAPKPAVSMKSMQDQEVKWVKLFPLRLKSQAKWIKQFLHGRS